jgi:hypothetical protein
MAKRSSVNAKVPRSVRRRRVCTERCAWDHDGRGNLVATSVSLQEVVAALVGVGGGSAFDISPLGVADERMGTPHHFEMPRPDVDPPLEVHIERAVWAHLATPRLNAGVWPFFTASLSLGHIGIPSSSSGWGQLFVGIAWAGGLRSSNAAVGDGGHDCDGKAYRREQFE